MNRAEETPVFTPPLSASLTSPQTSDTGS